MHSAFIALVVSGYFISLVMTYSSENIAHILGVAPIGLAASGFKHILMDSRSGFAGEAGVFIAVKGARHDGHDFVMQLAYKGVKCFVVERWKDEFDSLTNQVCFFLVDRSVDALQKIAAYHRQKFNAEVVGITGSNGKTIVKEWLFQLLEPELTIVRNPKSYNSQIGVPLSVWRLHEKAELGLFEAGISQPGEMELLNKVIQPTIGLFTHLGSAHDEHFSSRAEKVNEKFKLFEGCKKVVVCGDDPLVLEAALAATVEELVVWTRAANGDFSMLEGTTIKGASGRKVRQFITQTEVLPRGKGTHVILRPALAATDVALDFDICFTDAASIENAIHCRLLLAELGFGSGYNVSRFMQLSPVVMRLEMMEAKNNCVLINDSYSMDWDSLKIALDFLGRQVQFKKKSVVLSDIPGSLHGDAALASQEALEREKQLYSDLAALVAQFGITRVIGIGPRLLHYSAVFGDGAAFFASTADFLQAESKFYFEDEAILIKGARSFGFEQLCKLWQEKAHETQLAINLTAIADNLNYYRSKLDKKTKIMAMVKASSYGSGGLEIANLLAFHRVDYLAVAFVDEGVALRKAGVQLPILVLNPEERGFQTLLEYDLEPELFSLRTANNYFNFIDQVQAHGLHGKAVELRKNKAKVHLKLDTGMHRLGLEEEDLYVLLDWLKQRDNVVVTSVFSHLSSADDANEDDFTRGQIKLFKRFAASIEEELGYTVTKHLLNSPGITRFGDAQFDMVRLGIGLYGIGCTAEEQTQLTFAHQLTTTISQITHLEAGESIGYGRSFIAERAIHIATLPIGYADGLSRSLSNGKGGIVIHGKRVPIVGRICMDMCMVDISEVHAQEGDEVVVFGEGYPITMFAKDAGTIPYEILTSLSPRVKRVYYQE